MTGSASMFIDEMMRIWGCVRAEKTTPDISLSHILPAQASNQDGLDLCGVLESSSG
jgi:hypothetical protein